MNQKKFQTLQRKWYAKIAKEGFEDIEDTNSPNEMLLAWHNTRFQKNHTIDTFQAHQEYYSRARAFLHEHKFISKLERQIWEQHSEGLAYREIAKKVELTGDKTLKIINRLKGFMQGITVRDATEEDKAFIYSTWLKGVYYGSWAKEVDKKAFFDNYPKVIDKIMADKSVSVLVACLSSDTSVILGYAAFRPEKLDYVFIKEAWRKQGIAKELLKGLAFKEYTHTTELGKKLAKKQKLVYNPFSI